MSNVVSGADLPTVDDDKVRRGQAIRERRKALGIASVAKFARLHGSIKEDTISAAEHGRGSSGTYERLESWLSEQEANRGRAVVIPVGDPDAGFLEVTIAGNFGVSAVVKAPVENAEELMAMVDHLVQRLGTVQPEDDSKHP